MTKTITRPQPGVPGLWSRIQRFFEALEGLDETYQERLERRVSQLEGQVARLAADKTARAASR